MSKIHHFKSRYITDVAIEQDYICLIDFQKNSYYIDLKNKEVLKQFETWMKNVFLKGVNQFLLVFDCHTVEHDGQSDVIIDKLMNI